MTEAGKEANDWWSLTQICTPSQPPIDCSGTLHPPATQRSIIQRRAIFLFAPEPPATFTFQGLLGLGCDERWWCLVAMVVPCDSSVEKPRLSRRGLNHERTWNTFGKLPEVHEYVAQGSGNFELLLLMGHPLCPQAGRIFSLLLCYLSFWWLSCNVYRRLRSL